MLIWSESLMALSLLNPLRPGQQITPLCQIRSTTCFFIRAINSEQFLKMSFSNPFDDRKYYKPQLRKKIILLSPNQKMDSVSLISRFVLQKFDSIISSIITFVNLLYKYLHCILDCASQHIKFKIVTIWPFREKGFQFLPLWGYSHDFIYTRYLKWSYSYNQRREG